MKTDACRLPSNATNIIAKLNKGAAEKIVITAHTDAYEDTPGASDNASGIVVLLLVAEMLSDYRGENCIEIAKSLDTWCDRSRETKPIVHLTIVDRERSSWSLVSKSTGSHHSMEGHRGWTEGYQKNDPLQLNWFHRRGCLTRCMDPDEHTGCLTSACMVDCHFPGDHCSLLRDRLCLDVHHVDRCEIRHSRLR